MERTATVVGGGIAGLATAIGLSRTGWDVRLVERDAEPRAVGAGLTLWPNALRALDALGVGEGVRDVSHVISRTVIRRADGNVITELPVDRMAAQWGPLVTVHRPDLHGVLLDAFPGDRVFGSAATVDGGLVVVDGAETTTTLVVGADGIGSVVRGALVGPVAPRPTGQIAVRGVADTGPIRFDPGETWSDGVRFGLLPMRSGLTYWFAVVTNASAAERLDQTFAGWHAPIAAVLAAPVVGTAPALPLEDLPPLSRWHDGRRVVLVGDAAHAMTPNLGQGAAQALEDAAALIHELAQQPVAEALDAYERRRKRHVEKVVKRARVVGKVAHLTGVAAHARNLIMQATPQRVALRQSSAVLGPPR